MSIFAVALLIWLLPTLVFLVAAAIALPGTLAARAWGQAASAPVAARDNQLVATAGSEGEHVVVTG